MLVKYPQTGYLTPQRAEIIVKTINTVTINELDDNTVALKIYKEFLEKYPDHPLVKFLRKTINDWDNAKRTKANSALENAHK